jgi:hypothetical protein
MDVRDPANRQTTKWWWPIAVIAVALLVWGAMFALGAYLDLGSERPREGNARGLLKGLIVMGCTLAFLAFWGLALWNRSRRLKKSRSVKTAGSVSRGREAGDA